MINAAMDYIKSEPLDERMLTVKDSGSTACPINVDHEGSANAAVNSSTETVPTEVMTIRWMSIQCRRTWFQPEASETPNRRCLQILRPSIRSLANGRVIPCYLSWLLTSVHCAFSANSILSMGILALTMTVVGVALAFPAPFLNLGLLLLNQPSNPRTAIQIAPHDISGHLNGTLSRLASFLKEQPFVFVNRNLDIQMLYFSHQSAS
jgi:hypothetical protein